MCVISKNYLTYISCERKPFSQLSRLSYFNIKTIANLFVHKKPKILEWYSEPSRTSKMELFAKIVDG